ncbi:MAG TPA: type 2 lanthipeptide synthetase LanM, partial [Actinomycetota bacterium]|nr:type 2 lanthipeptide synthetase LanM [Actinomycetota bacterium]
MTTDDADRDALVRAEGVAWTARLSWARRQLPLLDPTAETRANLEKWQLAVDPGGLGGFDERLRRAGLDHDRALVAVSPVTDCPAEEPSWWPWYHQLVGAYPGEPLPAATGDDWLRLVDQRLPPGTASRIPFAHLLWPIVAAAWRSLVGREASLMADIAESAQQDLCRGLLARLSDAAAPCLSALMWEAVPFGQRFLARIDPESGEQPRTRYAEFCRAQAEGALTEVFTRFPVLGSVLAKVVGQWTQSVSELLVRLDRDRVALAARFQIPATTPLTAVQGAVGDTHNDGRSVCILSFGESRLVYKPRNVALEDLYERLVKALSRLTPQQPLRAANALTRSEPGGRDYGYVEYVTARPCATEQELQGFYRNAGRTLALLHSLAATDCHQENLIAVGSQLVLVDAETLFDMAAPPAARLSAAVELDVPGADPASVLRVGMLPTWLWLEGRQTALDISALGAAPGDVDVHGVGSRGWRHVNSDAMVPGGGDTRAVHPQSLPTPIGIEGPLSTYLDTLVAGFEQTYRLLATELAPRLRALREQSARLRRRTVIRPTYVYASLLAASVEPAALTSCAARGLVLERLTR